METKFTGRVKIWGNWLQWGHAPRKTSLAGLQRLNIPPLQTQCSGIFSVSGMETTHVGCLRKMAAGHASMGPRTSRRGNSVIISKELYTHELQWGHTLTGVETFIQHSTKSSEHSLQRGHTFTGVETEPPDQIRHHHPAASMGPRTNRRGNWLAPFLKLEEGELQWSHASSGVETVKTLSIRKSTPV
jgi:hypothetical protein